MICQYQIGRIMMRLIQEFCQYLRLPSEGEICVEHYYCAICVVCHYPRFMWILLLLSIVSFRNYRY
jgi:hypothetical protein